jgi:hypothetical protein
MSRLLTFIPACALAFVIGVPAHAQDSESLGDLARQVQKEKEKDKPNKAAKVYTNDDVATGSSSGSGAISNTPGQAKPVVRTAAASSSGAASGAPAAPSAEAQLASLASMLDQLDATDRATLVRNVLDGNEANFPGRASWEEHLFAAKQAYVSQGRALLLRISQIQASAEQLKGVQDPNDPRVKDMKAKLQQLVQAAQQIGSAFQAVIMEGKDLAAQASSH